MTRHVVLAGGMVALIVAWSGVPSAVLGDGFAAHMAAHMTLVAIAAPLIANATARSRFDIARRFPWAFPAILASLFELLVVWAWHAPLIHEAARHHAAAYIVEQASFLAAGLWLWTSVFWGSADHHIRRAGSAVMALLLTFSHMTLLGVLLALAPRPLYGHGGLATPAVLEDQQLGAAIMLVVGAVSYIGGGLYVSRNVLRDKRMLVAPR